MNIASFLDRPAALSPDRAGLVMDDGSVVTYGALAASTSAFAAELATRGVGAGDRIALIEWGGLRAAALTMAAAHLGAAAAHMNPLLTPGELAALVEVSGCVDLDLTPLDGASDAEPPTRAAGDDAAAVVLFTSGTTGLPKPVPITHAAIAARVKAYRAPFDPDRAPNASIMCMPSFHVGGLLGLLLSLWAGDTTVVQRRFDAGRWLELVAAHRVQSAMVVPTMLARILDHPAFPDTDLGSLALVSYGAAAAPEDLIRRAMAAMPGTGFANVFGQTETLGAYTTLSPDDHRDPRRIGSVGRPLPRVSLRVVDIASGADVPTGEVGELWVESPQNVEPGWLHTGDLARIDADGYVYPVGRRSDTINRGGEKFGPDEIATTVATHPAVAEAAVAGVPDAEMGERVGVLIVPCPGAPVPTTDELRAWCRTSLAPFKLPEVVVVVDALPYNELGKLPKRAIVEQLAR